MYLGIRRAVADHHIVAVLHTVADHHTVVHHIAADLHTAAVHRMVADLRTAVAAVHTVVAMKLVPEFPSKKTYARTCGY